MCATKHVCQKFSDEPITFIRLEATRPHSDACSWFDQSSTLRLQPSLCCQTKRRTLPLLWFTLINAVQSLRELAVGKLARLLQQNACFSEKSRHIIVYTCGCASLKTSREVLAFCLRQNSLRTACAMESSLEFSSSLGSVSSLLTRCRTFKVLVIGDSGVGKTCLTHRLCAGQFPSRVEATIGVDFRERLLDIDGERIKVKLGEV